jgi:hypothetical protein
MNERSNHTCTNVFRFKVVKVNSRYKFQVSSVWLERSEAQPRCSVSLGLTVQSSLEPLRVRAAQPPTSTVQYSCWKKNHQHLSELQHLASSATPRTSSTPPSQPHHTTKKEPFQEPFHPSISISTAASTLSSTKQPRPTSAPSRTPTPALALPPSHHRNRIQARGRTTVCSLSTRANNSEDV